MIPYRLHRLLFWLVCLGLIFMLSGCVTLATDRRKEGFAALQNGFASLAETPDLHKIIKIKEVTVHIVGHRRQFNWQVAAAYGSPVAAYANTNNEIWILGKVVKGRVIVNQAILGHEFQHLLNFQVNEIADPDQLDALGV